MLNAAIVVLCLVGAALHLGALAMTLAGMRRMRRLADVPVAEPVPPISIVSPACNEAERVSEAVRSWLRQQGVDLQIVVVNDRSTDGTGALLDELAASEPRVEALHITHLPDGWLGKVNAMQQGCAAATGDWILFLDADTHLAPQALRKAVGYAEAAGRDFLSVLPQIETAGVLGDTVWNLTLALFHIANRPWNIPDEGSPAIGASGAFLLVRRSALEAGPGLAWLKLEVADDFGLCLLIKEHGGSAELLCGAGEVSLTWYASYAEMTRRMQKNFYAITGRFSLARTVVQGLLLVAAGSWPMLALLYSSPVVLGAVASSQLLLVVNAWVAAGWSGRPRTAALLAPFGFFLVAYMVVRAGIVGHRSGGITWRGVLYPADLLRAQQRVKL